MEFEVGMVVTVVGRCEDFTDHLDGCTVTVIDGNVDEQGYIQVQDEDGFPWYVQATDVRSV